MSDKQRIVSGLLELQRTDHDGYLAMAAIIHAMMGVENIPVPEGSSRGAVMGVVRILRGGAAGRERE